MGGQYCGDAGSPFGIGASRGGKLQMEKFGGVRLGRGATYPGIPPIEVLRVVTPPEEVATPYPGVCSTIWFHDVGEPTEELPHTHSMDPACSRSRKTLLLLLSPAAGVSLPP